MPFRLRTRGPQPLEESNDRLYAAQLDLAKTRNETARRARRHVALLLRQVWPQASALLVRFGEDTYGNPDFTDAIPVAVYHQPHPDGISVLAADIDDEQTDLPNHITTGQWRLILGDLDLLLGLAADPDQPSPGHEHPADWPWGSDDGAERYLLLPDPE